MYWDGNMGAWGFVLMLVSFILFWGAIIAALVLFARSTSPGHRGSTGPGGSAAEDLLAERFARGDIDETEYTSRLAALRRARGA